MPNAPQTPRPDDKKPYSEFTYRLFSALVMGGLGLGAVYSGGVLLWFFCTILVIVMVFELALLTRAKAQTTPVLHLLIVLALVMIGLACYGALAFRAQFGFWAMIWVIVCVCAADSGAYGIGRTIGGPKCWPAISPNKTWSGTIGGWVCALVSGVAFAPLLSGQTALFFLALLSFIIALVAQAGDMFFSYLKRRAGCKDYGRILLGHGGILDRFDGMVGVFALCGLVLLFGYAVF